MERRQTRSGDPRRPPRGPWRYGDGAWEDVRRVEAERGDDPLSAEEGPRYRDSERPPPRGRGVDFAALFVLMDAIRRAVPGELQAQLTALIREALLTLRALIDWYLERLEGHDRSPRVEDIPIE